MTLKVCDPVAQTVRTGGVIDLSNTIFWGKIPTRLHISASFWKRVQSTGL